MNTPEISGSKPPNRGTIPRWMAVTLAVVVWLVAIPLAHGGIPWALSTVMPRYGWQHGAPGVWNRLGIIVVAVAAALLFWVLVIAITYTPQRVKLGLTPSSLMMRGPYRFTRNPMYVAELALWFGWSLLFGSPWVFAGFLVLLSIVTMIILPREERGLEAIFGQDYLHYKNRVPRWW